MSSTGNCVETVRDRELQCSAGDIEPQGVRHFYDVTCHKLDEKQVEYIISPRRLPLLEVGAQQVDSHPELG